MIAEDLLTKEGAEMVVKRGELYYADLSPVVGSEQGGVRPVLVVQNDTGNKYSPTVIAAAVTSQIHKAHAHRIAAGVRTCQGQRDIARTDSYDR